MKQFLALCLLLNSLWANDPCVSFEDVDSSSMIERIALVGRETSFVSLGSQGVVVQGVALLEQHPSFLNKLRKKYVGMPLTCGNLSLLKEDIVSFYQQNSLPFAWISIPKQSWENGSVKVVVEEAKLGAIHPIGNTYFSGSELTDCIRLKPGDAIVADKIMEDIAWMNRNPFRRTDAVWVPSKERGFADLELVTVDRWPYRVYAGADNTGTIATERARIFGGFNFGKTILPDSDIAYQFTCSPNWNRFYAHTVSARISCPWRHVAVLYGGYSQVEPMLEEVPLLHRKELGTSWQVDGRYRIPLFTTLSLMQEFVLGYDFKETSLRLQERVEGSPAWETTHRTADINQFMAGYELGFAKHHLKTSFVLELYGNPSGITKKNRSQDYREFSDHARASYVYVKMAHALKRKMIQEGWFSYDITGQISSTHLLPSEQLNLSGYDAVRGFDERIAIVDSGVILNVEIESPHVSPSKLWGCARDELYALLFFDGAVGAIHRSRFADSHTATLGSVGPGIRYQFDRYFTFRFDCGFQLWHSGFYNPSTYRYNAGAILSY